MLNQQLRKPDTTHCQLPGISIENRFIALERLNPIDPWLEKKAMGCS
jgi:hypothetical protein